MKNEIINVLDHGEISLVDHMGGDLSITRSARVSYDAEWRAGEDEKSDARLIGYLMNNRHTTPFEAVTVTFYVKAPIFVFRQWHRHRTFSYNEVSARYTPLPEEFYVPELGQITTQHSDNKQMRTDQQNKDAQAMAHLMKHQNKDAFHAYALLLDSGCPRELARSVLPVSTYSKMFATANLHNIFHFLRLRLHEHAQYEIRVYAEAMLEICQHVAPVATTAFIKTL